MYDIKIEDFFNETAMILKIINNIQLSNAFVSKKSIFCTISIHSKKSTTELATLLCKHKTRLQNTIVSHIFPSKDSFASINPGARLFFFVISFLTH